MLNSTIDTAQFFHVEVILNFKNCEFGLALIVCVLVDNKTFPIIRDMYTWIVQKFQREQRRPPPPMKATGDEEENTAPKE